MSSKRLAIAGASAMALTHLLGACSGGSETPGSEPGAGAGGSSTQGSGGQSAAGAGGAPSGVGGSSGLGGTMQGSGGSSSPTSDGSAAGTGGGAGAGAGRGGSAGTAGSAAADAAAVDAGPLDGLNIDGTCFPLCANGSVTDPDGDGYGYENQMTCVVPGSVPTRGRAGCATGIVRVPPAQADGVQAGPVCYPLCLSTAGATINVNGQGYGYDVLLQITCIVPGSAAAVMGSPCRTGLTRPPLPPPGDGFFIGGVCYPHCTNPAGDPDGDGWGFENNVCVFAGSAPATAALSCAPALVPPPPPPPGAGWLSDYTSTMFGQVDCAPLGFNDSTDINRSACVGRGAVQLNATNQIYFGAPGDLSTLWTGAQCTCPAGQTTCVPSCAGQQDCAMCLEIACNASGTHSFMGTGDTHNRFCRPGQSVVVQIIDACPHNHVNNTYWCTAARPNHVDISCSAFQAITQGSPVGTIGYVNTYVRPVNCNVGLGVKTF